MSESLTILSLTHDVLDNQLCLAHCMGLLLFVSRDLFMYFMFNSLCQVKNNQVGVMESFQSPDAPRKPHILLAASGSVAAIKFANLCHCFCEWAEVKAVVTKASLHFIDRTELPKELILYTDEDEWSTWTKIGDGVLHIELRRWADIMVIAPLSANTLGKVIMLHCSLPNLSLHIIILCVILF